MTTQVARHSTMKHWTHEVRRSLQVLPDDNYAVLYFDANRNDKAFGDKTNIAKGYVALISHATQEVLSTVSFPIFGAAGVSVSSMQGAMQVDNAGNLHIAFTHHNTPQNPHPANQTQSVRYIKATRSGNTFTLGSQQIVFPHAANEAIASLDIDIPGNSGDHPIIVNTYTNIATNKSHVLVHNRQAAGTWVTATVRSVDGLYHFPSVSIAARQDTNMSPFSFVITYTTVPLAADQGDFIFTGRANVGGAFIGTVSPWKTGLNKHQNDGYREFCAFHLPGEVFVIAGTTAMNPFRPFLAAVAVDQATGATTTVIEPYARSNNGGFFVKHRNIQFSSWSIVRGGDNGKLIAYHFDDENVYADFFHYEQSGNVLTINQMPQRVTLNSDISRFASTTPITISAGDHGKHAGKSDVGCVVTYAEPSYRHLLSMIDKPPACVNVFPENGMIFDRATPNLVARPGGSSQGNVIGLVEFQVALDVNFVSGVVDNIFSNYLWMNGSNTAEGFILDDRLVQNKYYMRSRTVDIMGNTGAWSSVTSFTISHKPTADSLAPADGTHLGFNPTSGVNLHWRFRDPDPLDEQSAYQVILKDSATGAVIHNTGKVAGSKNTVNIPVVESNTEKFLSWELTVWDRDDVSSDIPSSRFYLSKAPVVTITSPSASPVATATPTIAWSSVFFGGRAQASYRVMVYRISDKKTVYDSGFKTGTATSAVIPATHLRNKNNYAVRVVIQDTNDMQGQDVYGFSTSWPLPMLCDPPVIDITEYQSKGYAYITAIMPDVSSYVNKDFISGYTVYRRSYEAGGDEWVEVFTGTPVGTDFLSFKDYMLPSGIPTEYALSMIVDIYGEVQVGDPEQSKVVVVKPDYGQYWLIDVANPDLSMMLPQVTDDGWTDEYEQQDFNVIGRGRVVEVGDRVGNTGSLTTKLRDKLNGLPGVPVFNSIANPRLHTDSTGNSLPAWVLTNGSGTTTSLAEAPSFAPCPTSRTGLLNVSLTQASGNPSATFKQDVFRVEQGTSYTCSLWIEPSVSSVNTFVDMRVEYWNSQQDNGSVISSQSVRVVFDKTGSVAFPKVSNAALQPEYLAALQSHNWYRVDLPVAIPVGTIKAKVILTIDSTAVQNTIAVNLGGIAFTDRLSRFFDGDSVDAEWIGNPETDPSYTPGFYTARRMRQNIEAMKARRNDVLLRTPFGDTYRVQVGNISVARIPGVGSNEFVDVTVPYLEISDD